MLAAEARAVAAGSVMLRAEVRGSTQTWLFEEPAPMTIVVVAVYECSYLLTYLHTNKKENLWRNVADMVCTDVILIIFSSPKQKTVLSEYCDYLLLILTC